MRDFNKTTTGKHTSPAFLRPFVTAEACETLTQLYDEAKKLEFRDFDNARVNYDENREAQAFLDYFVATLVALENGGKFPEITQARLRGDIKHYSGLKDELASIQAFHGMTVQELEAMDPNPPFEPDAP